MLAPAAALAERIAAGCDGALLALVFLAAASQAAWPDSSPSASVLIFMFLFELADLILLPTPTC